MGSHTHEILRVGQEDNRVNIMRHDSGPGRSTARPPLDYNRAPSQRLQKLSLEEEEPGGSTVRPPLDYQLGTPRAIPG